ncbi:MAG: UDP-N-acetylmuramoyl-tripeptide--D-alanyl-D-alanine ligase [Cyanobacterium sp. T60_A2020_053]|nr:UDP-N-acetylmuramoyl-tripeptide--D-alanyl-D-alanine ligase [Cyanobacterium sp. T60_A2020_053]
MKVTFNLDYIRKITDAKVSNVNSDILVKPWQGISTDSRTLKKGQIFLALRGEKFDGHQFLSDAINLSASALIIDYDYDGEIEDIANVSILRVKNTLLAYQKIAQAWRQQFNIPVIGITGSVGKTSTKELISAVLNTQGRVLKTTANFNNEIGVPKTLLEIDESHDFAVIEMAMRARGEIALLTEIADPTVAIITNVGTAHIGLLGSREAIAEAKCELLANLRPDGVAILNGDNALLMKTAGMVWQGKTVTYGLENGDLKGQIVENDKIEVNGQIYPLPLQGDHHALNYLSALGVVQVLGLDEKPLRDGVEVVLPKGRARSINVGNDIILLDETYNAGFESMIASLKLLKQTKGARHLAVLGTMKELGDFAPQLHYQVGEMVRELNLDLLLILADEPATEKMAEGAVGINTEIYQNHNQLLARLQQEMRAGDRILFKASNSVGLGRIVEQLITS